MEYFDESREREEVELEFDSDPEELWRSLVADEEYPRYWSESVWSHDRRRRRSGRCPAVLAP